MNEKAFELEHKIESIQTEKQLLIGNFNIPVNKTIYNDSVKLLDVTP